MLSQVRGFGIWMEKKWNETGIIALLKCLNSFWAIYREWSIYMLFLTEVTYIIIVPLNYLPNNALHTLR